MEVSGTSAVPPWRAPARPRPVEPVAPEQAPKPPEAEATGNVFRPVPPAPQPSIDVQVDRREDGVQTVTVYDPYTGDVLHQLPPEQVIHVIDAALRRLQRGKDGPDGRH